MKRILHRAGQHQGRDLPNYTASEAALYLGLPVSTVRYWSMGRGDNLPLIKVAAKNPMLLSFFNLVEVHIISAIRRKHLLKMKKLRTAILWLKKHQPGEGSMQRFPLLSIDLMTDGLDLFINKYGQLINISANGQAVLRGVLEDYLKCIRKDEHGIPVLLHPRYKHNANDSGIIEIDPRVSGGRPIIRGTNIATSIIAERFRAGESVADLAMDYGRAQQDIEDSIRIETAA